MFNFSFVLGHRVKVWYSSVTPGGFIKSHFMLFKVYFFVFIMLFFSTVYSQNKHPLSICPKTRIFHLLVLEVLPPLGVAIREAFHRISSRENCPIWLLLVRDEVLFRLKAGWTLASLSFWICAASWTTRGSLHLIHWTLLLRRCSCTVVRGHRVCSFPWQQTDGVESPGPEARSDLTWIWAHSLSGIRRRAIAFVWRSRVQTTPLGGTLASVWGSRVQPGSEVWTETLLWRHRVQIRHGALRGPAAVRSCGVWPLTIRRNQFGLGGQRFCWRLNQ